MQTMQTTQNFPYHIDNKRQATTDQERARSLIWTRSVGHSVGHIGKDHTFLEQFCNVSGWHKANTKF